MKTFLTSFLTASTFLVVMPSAIAVTINFNETAPTSFGQNGSYNENGFTITATGDTELLTLEGNVGIPSADGTDFGYVHLEDVSFTLTGTAPFSLQSLDAAQLFNLPGGLVIVTGNFNGGGAISETLTTLGSNQWSNYNFSASWTNLDSVTFDSVNNSFGFDNIVVNESAAVPEPLTILGTTTALGFGALFKKKGAKKDT